MEHRLGTQAPGWHPSVRSFVEHHQLSGYLRLARNQGFGFDHQRAYEALKIDGISEADWRSQYARWARDTQPAGAVQAAITEMESQTPEVLASQTRFQQPFAAVLRSLWLGGLAESPLGLRLDSEPVFGTTPSGSLNAHVMREPQTRQAVILFEQGIFRFLHLLANVIARVLPAMPNDVLGDSQELSRFEFSFAVPHETAMDFRHLFMSYVATGVPAFEGPRPTGDRTMAASILLVEMEQFLLAHEIAHLTFGHLDRQVADKEQMWSQEEEADEEALQTVTSLSTSDGVSGALPIWAAYLAFSAFAMLDLCVGWLTYDTPKLRWVSETHPSFVSRRDRVLAFFSDREHSPDAMAAKSLCDLTQSLLDELSKPIVTVLRKGVALRHKPSPLWAERAKECSRPAENL